MQSCLVIPDIKSGFEKREREQNNLSYSGFLKIQLSRLEIEEEAKFKLWLLQTIHGYSKEGYTKHYLKNISSFKCECEENTLFVLTHIVNICTNHYNISKYHSINIISILGHWNRYT